MNTKEDDVTIILTCYNEETNIKNAYLVTRKILPKSEIIIFDDASKDRTYEIVKTLAKKDKKIKLIHTTSRIGKGASLDQAIKRAKHNFVIFMDIDLSTNPNHINELVYWLNRGYPMVIGSRYLGNRKRSVLRGLLSAGFNWGIKVVSGSSISDHQCGFKGFNRKDILKILPYVKDKHFFWDAEVLVKAQAAGLKVKEIPVEWTEHKQTKVRLGRDIKNMFFGGTRILFERIFKINWPSINT